MMNSDIAGQYTNGLISVEDFKTYQTTRIGSTTISDEEIEKYIITATNILNSFPFLGNIPKRYIVYRGTTSKEGTYLTTPLLELNSKRILIKTNNVLTGTVVGIQTENDIDLLKIDFDEEYPDFVDENCEIVSSYTSYYIHSYTQRCSFPRLLGNNENSDFIIPYNIKVFICELCSLLTKEDFYSKTKQGNVKKAVLDVIETEYFENTPESGVDSLPFALQSLLKPYLGTSGVVATKFII